MIKINVIKYITLGLISFLLISCGQDTGNAPTPLLQTQANLSDLCIDLNSLQISMSPAAGATGTETISGKLSAGEVLTVSTVVTFPGRCTISMNLVDPNTFFDFGTHQGTSTSDPVTTPTGGATDIEIRITCTSGGSNWDITFDCK